MQFIDYKSYGTTQIFMNGYPMMISSNGPSNWLGSNFNLYYAGIPNTTNTNLSYSPLDLGETLIYDRILKPSELSLVHQHLFSNYSISNVISSNGLIGWFDAGDYSSSVGRVLNTWNSKYGGLTLSNPNSNSFALVRNYSNIPGKSNLTFIDLNNGTPSYFVNMLPQTTTYSNLIVFYVALGNSNLTTDNYITSFGHSNGSVTYFGQSVKSVVLNDVVVGRKYRKETLCNQNQVIQNQVEFGNIIPNNPIVRLLASKIIDGFLDFPSNGTANINNDDIISGFLNPIFYYNDTGFIADINYQSDYYRPKFILINNLITELYNINSIYIPVVLELAKLNWLTYRFYSTFDTLNVSYKDEGIKLIILNKVLNGIYATTDFSKNPNNQPIISGAYASNTDYSLTRFDTVSQNSNNSVSLPFYGSNISNINIGGYLGTNFCKTQIGEVLIYNRPLSKYEYMNIFGYLQSKWCSPTVVSFPTDYVLRYDACNISLDFRNWISSENNGPLLNKFGTASVSFVYFNRPFLSNTTNVQYSNFITNIDLQKGFTIFTITSNANITGNIIFMNNTCNNTLKPNIFLSNAGSSNKVIIGNKYNWASPAADANIITNTHSFIPLSSQLLLNCVKYFPNTTSYSITTKGTNLEINSNSSYVYTNRTNSNITFSIGGLGSISSGLGFNSLIGEVLVYNRALNDYETELVSANLTEKWNTPLLYPISYTNNVVSCNFNLTFSPGLNNTLTLSNFYLINNRHPFSNAYNFPMIINYTESQLGTPYQVNSNLVFSNIVGSCNYLIRMSTSNPFGSCNVIIFSNITPPGRVSFSNFQSNLVIIRNNLEINSYFDNKTLVYCNIYLTNILCNDLFGYPRNNTTDIYVTLQSNHNSLNAIVGNVTCNLVFSDTNRSNLTITFTNLTELSNYRLTLYASNPSSTQIASNRFNPAFPIIATPYFLKTFPETLAYNIQTNYNFVTFLQVSGAAKTSNANDYYVTLISRPTTGNIFEPITTLRPTMDPFSLIVGASGTDRYPTLTNFRLSNLIGMTQYSNIRLFASNSTGQMVGINRSGIGDFTNRDSNSLGFFTTPPGPPIFPTNQTILTSNRGVNFIDFSNFRGPFLSCNSTPYPFTWDTTGLYSTNNKSNIFFFYQLQSNTTFLTNNWSNLTNNITTTLASGHTNVTINFLNLSTPPGSNLYIRFGNLKPRTPYTIHILASNSAGSNIYNNLNIPRLSNTTT